MKILLCTQYFLPETNAPAARWGYFVKYLANQGHEITVLTSFPNHPLGTIFPGYKNQWRLEENMEGMKIIRTWTFISASKKFLPRFLNYFSFIFSSFFVGLFLNDFDIMIASSPPLSVAILGRWLSQIKKIPLVLDIRDLWPEAIITTGYLSSKNWFYKLLENEEKKCYQKAKKILVNSMAIYQELIKNKGVIQEKIVFIPNGADLEFFKPINEEEKQKAKKDFNLENKFVVLYTGLLGFAQAPEVLVDAAEILKDNKDIIFIVAGAGPLEADLKFKIENLKLSNIVLLGQKPKAEMPKLIAMADVGLIPYKNKETYYKNIPSKMFDYLAGGIPVIINLDGEAARIIKEAQAGLVVKADDAKALSKGILELYANKTLREVMGRKGREYAEKNFDKKIAAQNLETILKNVKK